MDTITKYFGAYNLQQVEDATTAASWTGNWNLTASTFVSAPRSFTDTPTGNYSNNANTTYTYTPSIDLTNKSAAKVTFWAKWNIEADYDFVQFQVSTNNGSSWIGQCGQYTVSGTSANGSVQPNNQPVWEGEQPTWVLEEIDLSEYLGQVIKVRFQLRADGGTRKDGFYFDDFSIYYNESGASLAQNDAPELVLYPNPTTGAISLVGLQESPIYHIYNANGQLIQQGRCYSNQVKLLINAPAGIYYLELSNKQMRYKVVLLD